MSHARHPMHHQAARGAPRPRGLPGRRAALVQRLRRQRDPRRGAAPVPRRGPGARAHGVRVRHRLLEPLPALHEDLRLPRHPRPRVPARRRHQDGAAGPERVRQHRRRRLLQHRRGALDPRDPLQHEPDGDPARQPRVRAHQEAGVADLADRLQEQHDAARLAARGAEPADGDARRAERLVRRAGRRLDPGAALRHHRAGLPRTAASRSCASSSAAPSSCRRCSSRGCTIRGKTLLLRTRTASARAPSTSAHLQEPARARPARTSTEAREIASSEDPIPGRHPVPQPAACPATRTCATRAQLRTPSTIRAGLDAEFDKFTVWPDEERARRAA